MGEGPQMFKRALTSLLLQFVFLRLSPDLRKGIYRTILRLNPHMIGFKDSTLYPKLHSGFSSKASPLLISF